MSWSVSRPESSTNTSPCSIGFIVPASTLRYGSIFTRFTERPRAVSNFPTDAAAIPLPTADITPPTTKIYLWPARARFIPSLYHAAFTFSVGVKCGDSGGQQDNWTKHQVPPRYP